MRPSSVPRLELASCLPMTAGAMRPGDAQELRSAARQLPALAIVDLGVVRLDGRLLGLARPTDPIVVVTRYGSTERDELATTAVALKGRFAQCSGRNHERSAATPFGAYADGPKFFEEEE